MLFELLVFAVLFWLEWTKFYLVIGREKQDLNMRSSRDDVRTTLVLAFVKDMEKHRRLTKMPRNNEAMAMLRRIKRRKRGGGDWGPKPNG